MNVVCRIEWTDDEIKETFEHLYGQKPTDGELSDCLDEIDTEGMKET